MHRIANMNSNICMKRLAKSEKYELVDGTTPIRQLLRNQLGFTRNNQTKTQKEHFTLHFSNFTEKSLKSSRSHWAKYELVGMLRS